MTNAGDNNLAMVRMVAESLGHLLPEVVFLGGATTGLLITDKAAPEVRPTNDVDVIIEIFSRLDYYKLEESLRSLGFKQSMGPDDPICRWIIKDTKVDIMPTDETILGFSNKWYSPAIRNANKICLEGEIEIKIVAAPYFLATKIEAFEGRGKGDFIASYDMEDIIAVIDGRIELMEELKDAEQDLKKFLAIKFQQFLKKDSFFEALSGHLPPDSISQARKSKVIARMEEIAVLS
jgi:hypothetical protein